MLYIKDSENNTYSASSGVAEYYYPFSPSDGDAKYVLRFRPVYDSKDTFDKFEMYDEIATVCENAYNELNTYGNVYKNGYEFIDLGLPSGTKWLKCSIDNTKMSRTDAISIISSIGAKIPTTDQFEELRLHTYTDPERMWMVSKINPAKYIECPVRAMNRN
jgi:hypothetical protein